VLVYLLVRLKIKVEPTAHIATYVIIKRLSALASSVVTFIPMLHIAYSLTGLLFNTTLALSSDRTVAMNCS
jgi:hypothetical protein